MTELYKAGIIEVTEDEDEDLFDVAVHFDGDIFLPNVVFEGKDHALRQAKKLYDWLEANPKGEQRDFVKSDQKQAMPSAGCAYAKNDI